MSQINSNGDIQVNGGYLKIYTGQLTMQELHIYSTELCKLEILEQFLLATNWKCASGNSGQTIK